MGWSLQKGILTMTSSTMPRLGALRPFNNIQGVVALFAVLGALLATLGFANNKAATAEALQANGHMETYGEWSLFEPQVAQDQHGNSLAVWEEAAGTRYNIWAQHRPAGKAWSAATQIKTPGSGNAHRPRIAFDRNGNALAIWEQADGDRVGIWSSHFVAAMGWGNATRVESGVGKASTPDIAIDSKGHAVAVWHQLEGTQTQVWANRYLAFSGWGQAAPIAGGTNDALNPRVSVDAKGNAVVLWQQFDKSSADIWASQSKAGRGWGPGQLIKTDHADNAYPPVTVDGDGKIYAQLN
jgi:hypothetical protein